MMARLKGMQASLSKVVSSVRQNSESVATASVRPVEQQEAGFVAGADVSKALYTVPYHPGPLQPFNLLPTSLPVSG